MATLRHEGKVAMVTGAGQGVGRGVAVALAKDGARLVLVGRTGAKLTRPPSSSRRKVAKRYPSLAGDREKDIGRPVSWLCTEEAGYLTATTIMLDGGQMFIH